MRSFYGIVSYPLLVAFVTCVLFSTYTPTPAQAGPWRTVLGIFGAVTGAALMATLAASFGPIGIACAGMLGAGMGFVGGAAIGGILGGASGGFWGAMGGIGTGGILGAAIGALGAGMLAAQFGIVGICAGALIGAWAGGKLTGVFDDDEDQYKAYRSGATKYLQPGDKAKFNLSNLREKYHEAQWKLRQALTGGSASERQSAHQNYRDAQQKFFEARSGAMAR